MAKPIQPDENCLLKPVLAKGGGGDADGSQFEGDGSDGLVVKGVDHRW